MHQLCAGGTDGHPDGVPPLKFGVDEEHVAACVDGVEQLPVHIRVHTSQPEAHQPKARRRGDLKARVLKHPVRKVLRQRDVVSHVPPQRLAAVHP